MTDTQDDASAFDPLTAAVEMPRAQKVLGKKARSEIYEAAGRGDLDLVKDGHKTLVTVESIKRYQASWPRAIIKPPASKRRLRQRRKRSGGARKPA